MQMLMTSRIIVQDVFFGALSVIYRFFWTLRETISPKAKVHHTSITYIVDTYSLYLDKE